MTVGQTYLIWAFAIALHAQGAVAISVPSRLSTQELSASQEEMYGLVHQTMTAHELEQRGERLRAVIDTAYGDLKKNHTLGPQNYISELVATCIPVGTSFEDAEAIMHGAGLKTRIKVYTHETASMVGWADFSDRFLLSSAEVAIDLSPKTPRDFSSSVGKVVALITYAAP